MVDGEVDEVDDSVVDILVVAVLVPLEVAVEVIVMVSVDVGVVDRDEVADEVKNKELEIGREQAIAEGKPEQIVDKIAQGRLAKFLKENTFSFQYDKHNVIPRVKV